MGGGDEPENDKSQVKAHPTWQTFRPQDPHPPPPQPARPESGTNNGAPSQQAFSRDPEGSAGLFKETSREKARAPLRVAAKRYSRRPAEKSRMEEKSNPDESNPGHGVSPCLRVCLLAA